MTRTSLGDIIKLGKAEMLWRDVNEWGVSREFYEFIKPRRCIWASPEWLWNNDRGNGFDTDIFNTVRTREWMAELGVTEHIVEKDGIQRIEI